MSKKRIRYKPGDLFRIPGPGKRVAYGQILLDLQRLWKKTSVFDRHDDCCLAGPICSAGLLVQIFDHKGRRPAIEGFKTLKHWPPYFVLHDQIYSGEFPIIGHIPVTAKQLDFPEGTMDHGFPTEYYTFDEGGVSVQIQMTEKEYHSLGGTPGAKFQISTSKVIKAIDGDRQAAEIEFGFRDLRFSPRRKEILKRAGLNTKMSYRKMAEKTGGVLPEQMIFATEKLYPGTTCS